MAEEPAKLLTNQEPESLTNDSNVDNTSGEQAVRDSIGSGLEGDGDNQAGNSTTNVEKTNAMTNDGNNASMTLAGKTTNQYLTTIVSLFLLHLIITGDAELQVVNAERIGLIGCVKGCIYRPTTTAQLVACVVAHRLGNEIRKVFTECGEKGMRDCEGASQCSWVKPVQIIELAKLGADTGACFPEKLVPKPADLNSAFLLFSSVVQGPLPLHSVIIACLAMDSDGCAASRGVCTWCGDTDTEAYGSPALRAMCLPTSMYTEFCDSFKATTALVICPQETARRILAAKIMHDGCDAGCTYAPTNLAQLVPCIVRARLGSGFTATLRKCQQLHSTCNQSPNECTWVHPSDLELLRIFTSSTGSCFPKELVDDAGPLITKFGEYKSSVPNALSSLASFVDCLEKDSSTTCVGETCTWCGPVETAVYGTPPLMGVCLTKLMHTDYCDGFKATRRLTLCPHVVAARKIPATGCETGCHHPPKNLGQLVACNTAIHLGGDFALVKECSVHGKGPCDNAKACTWVEAKETGLKKKFGAGSGSCMPEKLVGDGVELVKKFTDFSPLVKPALPEHDTIADCLLKTGDGCKSGCGWCGFSDKAYPGPSPLTGLCLPSALNITYCAQLREPVDSANFCQQEIDKRKKEEEANKLREEEEANKPKKEKEANKPKKEEEDNKLREEEESNKPKEEEEDNKLREEWTQLNLVDTIGCASNCTYKPKNPAQLVACIAAAQFTGEVSNTAAQLQTCGEKITTDCKPDCEWAEPEGDATLKQLFPGFCIPKPLFEIAKKLSVFSKFLPLIEVVLIPSRAEVLGCLKNAGKAECPDATCGWCDGISKDAYPGKLPFTQFCLPKQVAELICNMLKKNEKNLELCPGKTAPNKTAPDVSVVGKNDNALSGAPLISCITPLCLWLLFHN